MELNFRKIFWGILLVLIGILWMLKNTGMIYFSWHALLNLWPLILIFWGISVLPVKNIIKVALLLISIGIGVFFLYQHNDNDDNYFFRWGRQSKDIEVQQYIVKYDTTLQKGILNFDAAAGTFIIKDTTSELIDFTANTNKDYYELISTTEGNTANVTFQPKKNHKHWDINENTVKLLLNTHPVWDAHFDIGAADINFDMSKFKVSQLDIDAGASSIKMKLGDLFSFTKVSVNAGASSIKIEIPTASGCEIKSDNFLSDKNFAGFNKIDDDTYRTQGFESAANKIMIDLDAGVSSISVVRY
ncbi:MAG: DUF5668 domain-containing protein [Bacteroidota bacterium]